MGLLGVCIYRTLQQAPLAAYGLQNSDRPSIKNALLYSLISWTKDNSIPVMDGDQPPILAGSKFSSFEESAEQVSDREFVEQLKDQGLMTRGTVWLGYLLETH